MGRNKYCDNCFRFAKKNAKFTEISRQKSRERDWSWEEKMLGSLCSLCSLCSLFSNLELEPPVVLPSPPEIILQADKRKVYFALYLQQEWSSVVSITEAYWLLLRNLQLLERLVWLICILHMSQEPMYEPVISFSHRTAKHNVRVCTVIQLKIVIHKSTGKFLCCRVNDQKSLKLRRNMLRRKQH